MATTTFVDYEDLNGDVRTVIFRNDISGGNRSIRHIERFTKGRGWAICNIHQIDLPVEEAIRQLSCYIAMLRNPSDLFWLKYGEE